MAGRPQRWQRPKEDSRKGKKTFRYTDERVTAAIGVIRREAAKRWGNRPPWTGPLVLRTLFIFEIPTSWPTKTRDLALDGQVWHIADPDYDQLLKLVMDALRGLIYVDDNQVVGPLPGSAKRYGHPARTEIEVMLLDQPEGAVTPGQHRMEQREAERAIALERGLLGRVDNTTKANSIGAFTRDNEAGSGAAPPRPMLRRRGGQ